MIKHLSKLVVVLACSPAVADSTVGAITASSPLWDRPSETAATITGACDAIASDSTNDGVPYEVHYVRPGPGGAQLIVAIASLEPTPLDLDPFLAVYCGEFDPNLPNANLLALDDDSGDYPDPGIIETYPLNAGGLYSIVVSSYSNMPSAQHGQYLIVLGPNIFFSSVCPADLNGDGELDFLDVSAFLSAYNTGGSAADLNFDGSADFLDISLFLTYYNTGCP